MSRGVEAKYEAARVSRLQAKHISLMVDNKHMLARQVHPKPKFEFRTPKSNRFQLLSLKQHEEEVVHLEGRFFMQKQVSSNMQTTLVTLQSAVNLSTQP
jgi:hypothetical protein